MPRERLSGKKALRRDQKALGAIDKYFGGVQALSIGGTTYTPAAMKAIYEDEIDVERALEAARAALKELLSRAVSVRTRAHTFHKALKAYVLATYGAQAATMLSDFAMQKATARPTVAKAELAIAKSKATRAARHTAGPKQKKAIKGAT